MAQKDSNNVCQALPLDTTQGNKAAELCISLAKLHEYSNKWMIDIFLGPMYSTSTTNNSLWQNTKVNFSMLNEHRAHNGMTHMQTRLNVFDWNANIQNQGETNQFSYYFNIRTLPMGKKFLAIRHYTYESTSSTALQAIPVYMMLLPLDENQTHHDFVKRKFPSGLSSTIIIPNPTIGGGGTLH